MDWEKIIIALLGLFAAGFCIKWIYKSRTENKSSVRIVSQKGNTVLGDLVAGDKETKNDIKL